MKLNESSLGAASITHHVDVSGCSRRQAEAAQLVSSDAEDVEEQSGDQAANHDSCDDGGSDHARVCTRAQQKQDSTSTWKVKSTQILFVPLTTGARTVSGENGIPAIVCGVV